VLGLLVACRGGVARGPASDTLRQGRAAYVRDLGALVADDAARARVLRLVRERRITAVVPYGLGPLLATLPGRVAIAVWIDEIHRAGGRVVAPIAALERLDDLTELHAQFAVATFDGLISEHEFWNHPDRAAALDELLALVAAMRHTAAQIGRGGRTVPVGVYLGYPTRAEAARLAPAVDFVFLDYSVTSPARAWQHVHSRGGPLRARFAWFAGAGVPVWPIFYAAGEVDMRASLLADGIAAAERRFQADLAADGAASGPGVAGFAYFTIEDLPEPPVMRR